MAGSKRALPKELIRRAEEVAQGAAARARAEAQEHVDLVRRRGGAIADAFFDIGMSLAKLREPRLFGALSYATFGALLEKELQMSRTQAYRLIEVTRQLPRREAVALGPAKSYALIELAKATPELDSAATLLRDRVTLPGRAGPVDVRQMSAEEIRRAARVERRSHLGASHRATDAELGEAASLAKRISGALGQLGIEGAAIRAVRRRKGERSERVSLRFDLPAHASPTLLRALRSFVKTSS